MTKDEREANRAAWAKRIADFRASGLSATQWCAANGLKIHQLRYWLKKIEAPAPAPTAVRWLPVNFSDPEPALMVRVGPATIEIQNGFDPELFITVVKTLSMRGFTAPAGKSRRLFFTIIKPPGRASTPSAS